MNYYRKINQTYCEMLRSGYGRMLRQTTTRRTITRKCLVKKNIKMWFLTWYLE